MAEAADEITRLRARVKELEKERDRLAGSLAVCGVIAREGDGTCLPEYETDSVAAVRELRARVTELERFWTPVTESLPPFDVPVWLIDTDGNIWIGARSDSEDGWLWGRCYDGWYYCNRGLWLASCVETDDAYHPTHWANLPQPPKHVKELNQ
jgi:hypothetical protein